MFFEVYLAAEAEAFGNVALVSVTTGVALNMYGKAASRGTKAVALIIVFSITIWTPKIFNTSASS